MNESIELNKFNNVVFDDVTHSYIINGNKLKSVTGIIKYFSTEFDTDFWSVKKGLDAINVKFGYDKTKRTFNIKGKEYTITKALDLSGVRDSTNSILTEWRIKSENSTILGSAVHNYIEFRYANKFYPTPTDVLQNPIILKRYNETIQLFHKFYNNTKKVLIPVRSELVMADEELMLGGMIDQLFYNLKYNEYQIWDWKTNEELNLDNKWQKLKSIFKKLDDCDYNKYSIQLNCYKELLQRNTNIKIGDCYICHLSSELPSYKVHKTLNLNKHIKYIFNNYNKIIK